MAFSLSPTVRMSVTSRTSGNSHGHEWESTERTEITTHGFRLERGCSSSA
jgi:hypothetical protein